MGDNFSKELKLAKSLQKQCDDNGKEIDPIRSADTLHEFGLLYKAKSPHKISLIQSAAFFNAAIVRQPSNKQFLKSLQDLCSHVLQVAGAEKMQVDLIEISNTVYSKINEMRVNTNEKLESVKVIPSNLTEEGKRKMEEKHINQIRVLQIEISGAYTNIMDYIANECVKIMGKPPCKYSITGMGSLARKEITPYSDFEHIIVLEEGVQNDKHYENILEYFRWFTVIFQLVIINLKETIIRSVAVQWLNDDSITGGDWFFDAPTTCGIKFDGMQLPACKFPLGRPWKTDNKPFTVELIKPVSEMLKYLYREEDLKNGFHLADVLSKTCFVSGYKDVHEDYETQARRILLSENSSLSSVELASLIHYEMGHDWKDFDPNKIRLVIFRTKRCNIKSVLYRSTTLLISAVGRFYSIEDYACFDVVEALLSKILITSETAHKLRYALSLSCAIRLKVYMAQKGQDDFIGGRDFDYSDFQSIEVLLRYIGEESLVEYFTVTRSLWRQIRKDKEFCLKDFACDAFIRFSVLVLFQFHERTLKEWESYCNRHPTKQISISREDMFIQLMVSRAFTACGKHSEALELYNELERQAENFDFNFLSTVLVEKVGCLANSPNNNVVAYITQAKSKLKTLNLPQNKLYKLLGFMALTEGNCKFALNQYQKAFLSLQEALAYYGKYEEQDCESAVLGCFLQIGLCLLMLDKPSDATEYYEAVLEYFQNTETRSPFSVLRDTLQGLQICYSKLNRPEKVLEYQRQALELQKKLN